VAHRAARTPDTTRGVPRCNGRAGGVIVMETVQRTGTATPAPWGSMDIATMSLQMASTVNDAAPPFTLIAGRLVAGAFGRRCCGSSGASRRPPPSSTVRGGRRDVPRVSFARGAPLLFGSADQRIEQAPRGQTEHAIRGWRQAFGFGFFPRDGCLSQDANVDAAAS
jgi:hypothetical protein